MPEYKSVEDMEAKALWILKVYSESRVKVTMEGHTIHLKYDKMDIKWLASELLEVYTDGFNDRCTLNLR